MIPTVRIAEAHGGATPQRHVCAATESFHFPPQYGYALDELEPGCGYGDER